MESKQSNKRPPAAVFVPRTMGVFILLIVILSFTAGALGRELALTLTGAVFLAVWVYCLFMTLFLALIHRRRARRVSIRISPREIAAGEQAEIIYTEDEWAQNSAASGALIAPNGKSGSMRPFFQLPGILVRCRLLLAARDGRRIRHDFRPCRPGGESFTVPWRGAYFSACDEFAVFDALGFFRFAFRIPQAGGARLLASPRAADEPLPVAARSGESNLRPEFSFQRTDNLIDHRPYVPGDDPRRINWKLFGHGGELFVREGEREPPPHANIYIVVDGEYDRLLYSAEAGRRGVDLLCENALAAALAFADSGMNVLIGCGAETGSKAVCHHGNTPAELASALAWPAALPLTTTELPPASEDRGILVFALPRASAETSALDRFLRDCANSNAGRKQAQSIELIFLYAGRTENGGTAPSGELAAAAETCAALYNRRPGVRAREHSLNSI
jgi:hypothetical protein